MRSKIHEIEDRLEKSTTPALRALLDSLGDVLVLSRCSDGSVLYATPSTSAIMAMPMNELLGSERAWLRHVDPNDRDRLHELIDAARDGAAIGDEARFSVVAPDEAVRHMSARAWRIEVDGEQLLVTAIRDETAAHIERQSLIAAAHSLRELSLRDPLTELWNRRGLESMTEQEVHRVRRTGLPLSAIFIDLDDFKSINDRFGHSEGDALLRIVAQAIARSVRPTDPVGRIGGDEFLALLPGASTGEASQVAERIRRAIERDTAHVGGSASLGVALVHDERVTVDTVVRRTQSVLHRSKRAGKNRVEGLRA